MDDVPRGPLTGVRIIDLTTVVMGPYATQILADLGADVIRVEAPRSQDRRRPQRPSRPGGDGGRLRHHAPNLGENTAELPIELGYDPERIEKILAHNR